MVVVVVGGGGEYVINKCTFIMNCSLCCFVSPVVSAIMVIKGRNQ